MAIVNKQEIIKRLIEKLRLDPGRERIAMRMGETLLPVIDVSEIGEYRVIRESITNQNSIDFVVPAGMAWDCEHIWVQYTSNATVGTRILRLEILNEAGDTVYIMLADSNQTASLVRLYLWSPSIATGDVSNNEAVMNMPKYIPENFTVRVRDGSDVDDTDDFIIAFAFREKSIEA